MRFVYELWLLVRDASFTYMRLGLQAACDAARRHADVTKRDSLVQKRSLVKVQSDYMKIHRIVTTYHSV